MGITLSPASDQITARSAPAEDAEQLFAEALAEFAPAIARITNARESRAHLRDDLQQELVHWTAFSIAQERVKAAQYQREIDALASLER